MLKTILASPWKRLGKRIEMRVVLRVDEDRLVDDPYRFMTHIAIREDERLLSHITGHYDMNLDEAAHDFKTRCDAEGIKI